MLKIKDDINLKELEKFGFSRDITYWKAKSGETNYIGKLNYNDTRFTRFYLSKKDDISNSYVYLIGEDLDLLYDLIKADLVEKVDE